MWPNYCQPAAPYDALKLKREDFFTFLLQWNKYIEIGHLGFWNYFLCSDFFEILLHPTTLTQLTIIAYIDSKGSMDCWKTQNNQIGVRSTCQILSFVCWLHQNKYSENLDVSSSESLQYILLVVFLLLQPSKCKCGLWREWRHLFNANFCSRWHHITTTALYWPTNDTMHTATLHTANCLGYHITTTALHWTGQQMVRPLHLTGADTSQNHL